MTRLFVQIFSAILLTMVLSFALVVVLFDRAMDREFRENPPEFLDAIGVAMKRELVEIETTNELADAVARLQEESGMPMELVSFDHELLTKAYRARLVQGQTVHHMTFQPGPIIFLSLGGDRVLKVGPVRGFPTPRPFDAMLMLLVIVIVVGVVGMVMTYPQVRRLRALEGATEKLAKGVLDVRLRMGGGGPIGDVARRFDDMAETIQELLERQRELVQAVAHEIRTPISRIRYGLEMAAIADDEQEREQCEAGVEEDLIELDELVGELLIYCRYDKGTTGLPFQESNLNEVIEAQVRRQSEHYPDLVLQKELPSTSRAIVHQSSFKRAMRNLLLNACRHAKGKVMVRMTNDPDSVVIEVHDDGPGVPLTERHRIFDPFARVDSSRNRATGGVGLGLAIVQRILSAHGGSVEVDESPLGGALFRSKWPRSPA